MICSSLKANIGHLEACAAIAGLASLFSTLLGAAIASNAQLRRLNSHIIALGVGTQFWIVVSAVPCKLAEHRLSSFGFGGTIAHGLVASDIASNDTRRATAERDSLFRSQASNCIPPLRMMLRSESSFAPRDPDSLMHVQGHLVPSA